MKQAIFLLLFSFVLQSIVEAESLPHQGLVISDRVRLRSDPSLDGKVVGRVDHGTLLKVLSRTGTSMAVEDGGERYWWYQVTTPDKTTGWIYGAFLYFEAPSDSASHEVSKICQFSLRMGDGTVTNFTTAVYESSPDLATAEDEDRFATLRLLTAHDDSGVPLFFHISPEQAKTVDAFPSEDHWFLMPSDMGGYKKLTDAFDEERIAVNLKVRSLGNGGMAVDFELECTYNEKMHYFQVNTVRVLQKSDMGGGEVPSSE